MPIHWIDGIINPGIARIVHVQPGDHHIGEVLLKYGDRPVTIFGRGSYDEIKQKLKEQFPNCKLVSNQEFLCELDHIKLFGVKSDAQCLTTGDEGAAET